MGKTTEKNMDFRAAESYSSEQRQLHRSRGYSILLLGCLLLPGFSVVDYFFAPDHFRLFLHYRLIGLFAGAVLLLCHHYLFSRHLPWLYGFIGYLFAGGLLLVLTAQVGRDQAPYYVGLIVLITIYTTLAPLTASQTFISGLLLVAGYIAVLLWSGFGLWAPHLWGFNHVFFLFCFICIMATQSATLTSARKLEFSLRLKEQEAATELEQQAKQLEQEVNHRTSLKKMSEQKYQLLFNSIVDDVVLVNSSGVILQANNTFLNHFGPQVVAEKCSIYELLPPKHRVEFRKHLDALYERDIPFPEYPVTFLLPGNYPLIVEIKASLLQRDDQRVGIQLVMRDIRARLELENEVVSSLKTAQLTEEAAILALAKLSEYRGGEPGSHLERVRECCRLVAAALSRSTPYQDQIDITFVNDIYHASVLHDIGKVSIADTLLRKSGPLTELERDIVRNHTIAGGDVIKEMEGMGHGSEFLSMAKSIAYFHHERWDGKGYPHGLMGEEIPLAARIVSIADTYDELSAPQNESFSRGVHRSAVHEIVLNSGKMFDPVIVNTFVQCEQEIYNVRLRYKRA